MLTIQEAANRMGLSPSAIRYYDRNHLLPAVQRDKNNNRLFFEEDLIWIKMVQTLREMNMPIHTIRDYVNLAREGKSTVSTRLQLMSHHQAELLAELQQAQLRYVMANRWINHYVTVLTDPNLDQFPKQVNKDFADNLKTGFETELHASSDYK